MMNGVERLKEMNKGFDANALSMLMWGRGAKEMQGIMRLTNERIADGETEAKKLGMSMSGENVQAMRSYKEAMHEVGEVFESIQIQIGTQLLPVLTNLGMWFAHNGPAIIIPVVSAFRALADIMSYTSVQVALAILVFRGPLIATWGVLANFGAAVVMVFQRVALGVQGPMTAMGSSLMGMLNPWALLAAGLVLAGIGLERWMSSAKRAAEEHAKMVSEMKSGSDEFLRLSEKVEASQRVLDSSKATDKDKKRAQEDLLITVKQLRAQFPEYAAQLTDEQIKQKGVLGVLKEINTQRQIATNLIIKQTEATLAKTQADLVELAGSTAAAQGMAGNNALMGVWALIQGKRTASAGEAIKLYRKQLVELYDTLKLLKGDAETPKKGSKFNDKEKEEPDQRMKGWEKDLREREAGEAEAAAKLNMFYEKDYAAEVKYWRDKLALKGLEPKEVTAIQEKIATLTMAGLQRNLEAKKASIEAEIAGEKHNLDAKLALLDQEQAMYQKGSKGWEEVEKKKAQVREQVNAKLIELEKSRVTTEAALKTKAVELDEEGTRHRLALGVITDAQALQAQLAYENRRWTIASDAARALAALEPDPAKRQELLNQLLVAEQEHTNKVTQLSNNVMQEKASRFRTFFDGITSGFATAVQGLIKGTMSWGQAFKSVMGSAFDFAIKAIVEWGLSYVKQLLIGKAVHTATATSAVIENSAEAGTGAMASAAKIPYIGWAIAIGAGLAVFAAANSMKSAAGGWDTVPNDQVAQIHKGEMVMSAPLAQGIRDMVKNGQTGGGGSVTHNYTIHALDSKSFEEALRSNRTALARVSSQMVKDGVR